MVARGVVPPGVGSHRRLRSWVTVLDMSIDEIAPTAEPGEAHSHATPHKLWLLPLSAVELWLLPLLAHRGGLLGQCRGPIGYLPAEQLKGIEGELSKVSISSLVRHTISLYEMAVKIIGGFPHRNGVVNGARLF